jgi:hypothetical protein
VPDDSQIIITVDGTPDYTFQAGVDGVSCPRIERQMTGDGPVEWTYPFVAPMPWRHAHVSIADDLGEFHTARVVLRTPPDTACTTENATIVARGYNESLAGDRKFDVSTAYGPVYEALVVTAPDHPQISQVVTLAGTTNEAVTHAVSQLGSSVSVGAVTGTGFDLTETENFIGRPALDVIQMATARGGGLATPYTWYVRKGIFTYRPLDTAARYAVTIGDGVNFRPSDDASKIYTRVIVIYGKNDAVTYPAVIDYTHLPSIVDLVVNAGTEVKTQADALQLAQGLYARLQTFELGWAGQLIIQPDAEILELGLPINPWRVNGAQFMRMVNLNPMSRYGESIPSEMLITKVSYDGPNGGVTTIDLGEIRDVSGRTASLIRKTLFAVNSRSIWSQMEHNLSTPLRDNDKARTVGPDIATSTTDLTDASGNPVPPPIDHGLVAVSPEQETVHPDVETPKPVTIAIVCGFWHGTDASGVALTPPFREPSVPIPPMQIDRWEMETDAAATVTYKLYRKSTGALMTTVNLAGTTENSSTLTPASNPALRIVTKDSVIPELTVADDSATIHWCVIRLWGSRLFPGYKGGAAGAAVYGLT